MERKHGMLYFAERYFLLISPRKVMKVANKLVHVWEYKDCPIGATKTPVESFLWGPPRSLSYSLHKCTARLSVGLQELHWCWLARWCGLRKEKKRLRWQGNPCLFELRKKFTSGASTTQTSTIKRGKRSLVGVGRVLKRAMWSFLRNFNRAVEKFSAKSCGCLRIFQPLCNRSWFQPHQPHFNRAWKCLTLNVFQPPTCVYDVG